MITIERVNQRLPKRVLIFEIVPVPVPVPVLGFFREEDLDVDVDVLLLVVVGELIEEAAPVVAPVLVPVG